MRNSGPIKLYSHAITSTLSDSQTNLQPALHFEDAHDLFIGIVTSGNCQLQFFAEEKFWRDIMKLQRSQLQGVREKQNGGVAT